MSTGKRIYRPRELSRRQFLGLGAAGAGLLLAGCGGGGQSYGEGGGGGAAEFHGAYPYQLPPIGHFNTFVTNAFFAADALSGRTGDADGDVQVGRAEVRALHGYRVGIRTARRVQGNVAQGREVERRLGVHLEGHRRHLQHTPPAGAARVELSCVRGARRRLQPDFQDERPLHRRRAPCPQGAHQGELGLRRMV